MLAMEVDGLRIMAAIEVEGVDQRVFVAEESPHALSLRLVVCLCETLLGEFGILFDEGFGDDKLLHAVLPRVLVSLLSRHAVFHHRVADVEGWIDDDAVEAI